MENRFDHLQHLFNEAIDLPPSQQLRFLEEACAGDNELLNEVKALLFSNKKAYHTIGETMGDFAAPLIKEWESVYPDAKDYIGKTLGHYHITKRIGRGGMGTVFLGERTDGFKRLGAIKILRRGMDTEDILHRFHTEQQILASLDHPNIAKLIDAGITDDGLPYFILEYIEGTAIDQYCNEQLLSTTARLKLFQEVCKAVQFAHQNLIVHRDLKPRNILVTQKGEVKLLDFGIAKVLNPQKTELPEWKTQAEIRVLTPEYASPEQLKGENISTASDVYQLGILLYVLLTDCHPFPNRKKSRDFQEVSFTKPSEKIAQLQNTSLTIHNKQQIYPQAIAQARRTSIEKLKKEFKGDLDIILATALQTNLSRRYASVIQLSEDLRRHQEGLPVWAQADSISYKITKFIARNRVSTIWGLILLTLLSVSGVFYTWQIALQRDKAALEAEKSKQFANYIAGLLSPENLALAKEGKISFKDWLDQSRKNSRPKSPEVQAQILQTLGNAYQSLRLSDTAIQLLEEAVNLQKKIKPQNPEAIAQALELLSAGYASGNNWDKAVALAQEAVVYAKKAKHEMQLAKSLNHLGNMYGEAHHFKNALTAFKSAETLFKTLNLPETHIEIARLNRNWGAMHYYESAWNLAKPKLEKTLPVYQKAFGKQNIETVSVLSMLGRTAVFTGNYNQALILQKEALMHRKEMYGTNHPLIASSLSGLGGVYFIMSDFKNAQKCLKESIEIKTKLNINHVEDQTELAWAEFHLGLKTNANHQFAQVYNQILNEKQKIKIITEADYLNRISKNFIIGRYAYFLLKNGEVNQATLLLKTALQEMKSDLTHIKYNKKILMAMIWRTETAYGACLTELNKLNIAERYLKVGYDSLATQTGLYGRGARERQTDLLKLYQKLGNKTQVQLYQALLK